MAFFEGCPVGWGGVPTGAGLVDGGVDQGPWLQERVGGGVGTMAVPKKREGWGLVGCSKRKGRVGAWLAVPKRSKSRVTDKKTWSHGGPRTPDFGGHGKENLESRRPPEPWTLVVTEKKTWSHGHPQTPDFGGHRKENLESRGPPNPGLWWSQKRKPGVTDAPEPRTFEALSVSLAKRDFMRASLRSVLEPFLFLSRNGISCEEVAL